MYQKMSKLLINVYNKLLDTAYFTERDELLS